MFFVIPQRQSSSKTKLPPHKHKLVCKICRSLVSERRYLLAIDGSTPYHSFENPMGRHFNILTLSHCQAIVDASPPSLEFTWFAGYEWIIVCCAVCQEHLGWRFQSAAKQPSQFFGLIQEKLEDSPE